jgi:hypothetical protein
MGKKLLFNAIRMKKWRVYAKDLLQKLMKV